MKKVFVLCLCLILVFIMLPGTALPAKAYSSGNWEYTLSGGKATITRYNGSDAAVTIPNPLGGYPVAAIGNDAFKGCAAITNVTIPNGVTSIGSYVFSGCTSLAEITVPASVSSIGVGAFQNCSSLSNAAILGDVSQIGSYTFYGCNMLQTVTLPSGVTSIGGYAFYDCWSLHTVNFGGSMTQWEGIAVNTGNEDLTTAAICYASGAVAATGICGRNGSDAVVWTLDNAGTLTISGTGEMSGYSFDSTPWYEFRDMITSVVIAPGVTNIGPYAFYDCDNLADVSIPSGLTAIGSYAFAYCRALTNVTIPSGVTVIGQSAFSDCRSLQGISIPVGVTVLESALLEYDESLTSLVIPDGVTRIEDDALFLCSALTSLTIPASVTEIGAFAINGCISLTDVYYGGTEAQWEKISIADSNLSLTDAEIHFLGIPLAVNDITANKSSVSTGETITWTATATGTGTLRYCFYVYNGSTVVKKGSYSTGKSYSYTPDAVGSYQVKVFVKDGNGLVVSRIGGAVTVTAGPPVIGSITANKSTAAVGEPVTWTAAASGGTGALKYCFYIYRNGTVVQKGSYSSAKTFNYTPTEAGTYTAKVFVKDSAGKSASKLSGGVPVNAGLPVINSITANKASAVPGEVITWTASASGGTGALKYCFYIYRNGTVVQKGSYSSTKTVNYTPTEGGTYTAKVFVKDSAGKSASKLSTGVTVSAGTLAINSISASKSSVSVSETITWTASASGGTGTLRYAFYLYKDGAVIGKTGYGFSKTYSYTPTAQGSYRVKVFVKDGNGTTLSKLSGIVLCSL